MKRETYLWIAKMIKRLLVCRVCLLEIVHHQVAMSKTPPDISIVRVKLEYVVDIINGLVKLFLMAQNARNR